MDASSDITHQGMGAIVHDAGVAFRVWAPNASAVFVTGDFNDWSEDANPMTDDEGYWYADVAGARAGQEYRYRIEGPSGSLSRIDPYARAVTNSVGNAIVVGDDYDWEGDDFQTPAWNTLVIYELHIGTFSRADAEVPGQFAEAIDRLDHLKALGVNAIQIMPAMEFAGDVSWGYNPAHIFAIESAYGGPEAFKDFVKAAHRAGFAVILDVVYNHFGPSDIDLWQFDGWSEGDKGGIYFYNDWRAETPWGETRPDYGRPEVRQFIRDNAVFWLEEYRVDGLRFDMTLYIRNVRGEETDGDSLRDGWSLLQLVNGEIAERFPGRITIAEDLRGKSEMTGTPDEGGAGFGAQWDAQFVHPVRETLIAASDDERSMETIAAVLTHSYNGDPFQRVIYTESHDEVANGKARVPHEIDSDGQDHWVAQKRSTLGAVLIFTTPGIPMIFQGQEFLQGDWFDDTVPLDWQRSEDFSGIVRLYRDLIALRLDVDGPARGLTGSLVEILLLDEERKIVVYRRRLDDAEPGVIVVLNFRAQPAEDVRFDLPEDGPWTLRLNTDWAGYSRDFGDHESGDLAVSEEPDGGHSWRGTCSMGGYTALIYTRRE